MHQMHMRNKSEKVVCENVNKIISHIETLRNTVTSFYSHLLMLIPMQYTKSELNEKEHNYLSISFLNSVQ